MIKESLEELRRKVDEYGRRYRHPDLDELELLGPYALSQDDTFVTDPKMRWDKQWPNSDRAGVYVIYSQDGTLLYIGKALHLGKRLANYFQYEFPVTKDKRCRVIPEWKPTPMYVCTIAVPQKSRFEACALEEYLINESKPKPRINVRVDPHWREGAISAA